jgi:hypothetical protein
MGWQVSIAAVIRVGTVPTSLAHLRSIRARNLAPLDSSGANIDDTGHAIRPAVGAPC